VFLTEDEFLDAADLLVTAGLWHRLPKSRGGPGWEFHDWHDYQPAKQAVQKAAEKKSNHEWLHKSAPGKQVKQRVIRRDGNWCRYCGIEVRVDGDRRSPARRTFDFVDPDVELDRSANPSREALDRAVDAVVVACGYCNAVKGMRTPSDAEMVLRDPPEQARRDPPRSIRDSVATEIRPNREAGTGRNGSGRIGSDLDGAGQVGSGREPSAGAGRLSVRGVGG
jgi:hypothetical protein